MKHAGLSGVEYFIWCDLLGRPAVDVPTLNPMDRAAALPAWCCPELIATDAARARLRVWSRAGSVEPTAEDLVRRLRYLGDGEIRVVVLEALHERIPPPVVSFLLESVLFGGTGWSTGGWAFCTALPPGPVLRVVLIAGHSRDVGAVLDLTLHECSHQWLMAEPENPIPAESVYNEMAGALLAAAKKPDLMRHLQGVEARAEEQADALARAWGGHNAGACERSTNYIRREAQQLQEIFGESDS